PRSRSTAATMPASPSASSARRTAFMVGLARIELATSSLSGMRSNRLSYSPSVGTATLAPTRIGLGGDLSCGFLFDHRDADAPDEVADEVEEHRQQHVERTPG